MKTGKVKFFNESKGFGFILEDETNAEIFVHHSGLINITERKMMQQIAKSKNAQFLFQYFSSVWAYTFKVFNRTV